MSAFTQEDNIADQRDIVIKSDFTAALWATGRRKDNGLFKGNTINTYIHKASQGQAEQGGINDHY